MPRSALALADGAGPRDDADRSDHRDGMAGTRGRLTDTIACHLDITAGRCTASTPGELPDIGASTVQ
jgi:hypothetical protein